MLIISLWIFALLLMFIGISLAPVPIIAFFVIGMLYAIFGKG